jgi:hypothetical protein
MENTGSVGFRLVQPGLNYRLNRFQTWLSRFSRGPLYSVGPWTGISCAKYRLSWFLDQLNRFSLRSTLPLSRWVDRFLLCWISAQSVLIPAQLVFEQKGQTFSYLLWAPIYNHSYLYPHESTNESLFLT